MIDWKTISRLIFPAMLGAMAGVAGLFKFGVLEAPGETVQVFIYLFTGLFVLLLIFDTSYHSLKGQGQACPYCGHLRQKKPFRVYGQCPSCHK